MHNIFVIIWYVMQEKLRESCISMGNISLATNYVMQV